MPKLAPGKKSPTPESTKQKKVSQRKAGCGRDKTTQYNEEPDCPGVVAHPQFLSEVAEFAVSTPGQKLWALVSPKSSKQLSKSDPQQRRRSKAPGECEAPGECILFQLVNVVKVPVEVLQASQGFLF